MHGLKPKPLAGLSLPVIDTGAYFEARAKGIATGKAAQLLGEEIREACHKAGMFYLIGHNISHELIDQLMAENARFFALSESEKQKITCKNSPHFRGYGLLKNSRDWREQIHLGVDTSINARSDAIYRRLEGPNQWPTQRTEQFKSTALAYIDAIESLSRIVLTALAEALDKPSDFFTNRMKNNPYLLTKFMSYLPQDVERKAEETQTGVTAHCDWSWLTFLIQDNVGGLEARDINGSWHKVTPLDYSLVVNTGELLEIETGGYLRASPHRVINERIDRQRFSNAVFINPDLDAEIFPSPDYARCVPALSNEDAHVHKVIRPGTTLDTFVFGDSEWQRKGLGHWCYQSSCLTEY